MAVVVAFISQKGGVGKSTLARALLAVAAHSMTVRLADLDPQQASVVAWERARHRNHVVGPPCEVVPYRNFRDAVAASGNVDLLIVDTPARTSRATLEIAKQAHLVVQPTGASSDDLTPAILTFHELAKEGVAKDRLAMAVCRVLSDGEVDTVRAYVQDAGYAVLPGAIPERIAYREAQNRGRSITETGAAKTNAQADALMSALLKRINVESKRVSRAKEKRAERT
jgi:chromosome partitioning protein